MRECARPGGSTEQAEVYPVYVAWCHEQARRPLGKQRFNDRVAALPVITKLKTAGIDTFQGMTLVKFAEDFASATSWASAM